MFLLIQRIPERNHFSEIIQLIDQIPDAELECCSIPRSSITANYIQEQEKLNRPLLTFILDNMTDKEIDLENHSRCTPGCVIM